MITNITDFILTGFYFGKIKYMPGTFGTIPAILIFIYLFNNSLILNIVILLILFFLSILLLNYSYKKKLFENIDDKSIVIDEIIGYLSFMIFFDSNITNIVLGFLLFRFFDIIKPYPISYVDKKIKNGFGVMFDDLLAGLFSGIFLYYINYAVL